MRELLESGRLIDLALIVTGIELVVLMLRRRITKRGLSALDLVGQLLAGACLLLALRCALSGGDQTWTLLFFSASLPAHLFDLARRLRKQRVAA